MTNNVNEDVDLGVRNMKRMGNANRKKVNKLFIGLLGIILIGMIAACSGETESNVEDRSMPMLEEVSEIDEETVVQKSEEVPEKVTAMVEAEAEPTAEPTPEPTSTPTPASTSTPVPTPEPTSTPKTTPEPTAEPVVERALVPAGTDYILNTNTKKFHYTGCSSVKQMKDKNKKYYTGTREECIGMGYDPCGRCEP